MTDTERIATALMGWMEIKRPIGAPIEGRFYRLPNAHSQSWVCAFDGGDWRGPGDWPDFTTLDGARLFEDALANGVGQFTGAGALTRYVMHLQEADPESARFSGLRATPAQRVAACLRVLDEAGLCPAATGP